MGQAKKRGIQADRIKSARGAVAADIAAARQATELPVDADFVAYVLQDAVDRQFLCKLAAGGSALFSANPAQAVRFERREKAQQSLVELVGDLRVALLFETDSHLMSVFDR